MKTLIEWNPQRLRQSPLFAPLQPVLAGFAGANFPAQEELNALLAAREIPVRVCSGKRLQFVAQAYGELPFEAQYEPRCYLTGELQTRPDNWHDLFNALVWLTFPAAKAVINARHYQDLCAAPDRAGGRRGDGRDMLTLFDESGVVVVYADDELAGLLRNFRWKELFWQHRAQVNAAMEFYLFGHGLYEKAMQPYIGMTGQGLLLAVEQEFFAMSLPERLVHLDSLLTNYLNARQHCRSTRELSPVPLLGVPGWSAANGDPHYYDNTGYFRTGRQLRIQPAESIIQQRSLR